MSEHAPIDFDDLAAIAWRLGSMLAPSQLQGYLMGQLAAGGELSEAAWLSQAWQLIDAVEPPAEEDNQQLVAMLQQTRDFFQDPGFTGQLMMPDDEVELSQRAECLGFWCQGFLTGFALVGKEKQAQQGQQQYSATVSEALSDMAAIAQISLSDDELPSEQSETDFFEVLEYVRMAALTVYFDCLPERADDDSERLTPAATPEQDIQSPAGLFSKKQLH